MCKITEPINICRRDLSFLGFKCLANCNDPLLSPLIDITFLKLD